MRTLRIAPLAEGGSDRALLPIVSWHIRRRYPEVALAQPAFETKGPGPILDAMRELVDRERPDILLVHRDADTTPLADRRREIPDLDGRLVRMVPVRMTETWLLTDERAIREAAGNPNGKVPLRLPELGRLEAIPDPKRVLKDMLVAASELSGRRRRKRFERELGRMVHAVADYTADFTVLERLPAFKAFAQDLDSALARAYLSAG